MNKLFDTLSGIINENPSLVSEEDVDKIHNLPNPPPVKVTAGEIYVRKCRLTGDGINRHFGRFHTEDLQMLLDKVQGVSCLIGHRKDMAGIARFFSGGIEKYPARELESGEMTEMSFIVPKIYWMKSHSRAEDLKTNIDGGIYHQASISWYFEKPVCGLCGKDIRECDHVPGKRYGGKLCYFWYTNIGDVLEGSIVFAGGHPGTGFELNDSGEKESFGHNEIYKIENNGRIGTKDILPYLKNIDRGTLYLVGDIARQGWTENTIDILPEPEISENICELLPPYLKNRLILHTSFDPPGACVKVTSGSVLEIENIPHPESLDAAKCDTTGLEINSNNGLPDSKMATCNVFRQKDDIRKVFSAADVDLNKWPLVVMSCYEGLQVEISHSDLFSNCLENSIGQDQLSGRLWGFPQIQELFSELRRMELGEFRLSGELIAFKGRNRISMTEFLLSEELSPGKARILLKVFDFKTKSFENSQGLAARLERFRSLVSRSAIMQVVSHSLVKNRTGLSEAVNSLSTKYGVLVTSDIKENGDCLILFIPKERVLDVAVQGVVKRKNGRVYSAAVRNGDTAELIGSTHITTREFETGEIISVAVESLFFNDNRWGWRNPRVIGRSYLRNSPDTIETVKKLSDIISGQVTAESSDKGTEGKSSIEHKKNSLSGASNVFNTVLQENNENLLIQIPVSGTVKVSEISFDNYSRLNTGFWFCTSFVEKQNGNEDLKNRILKERIDTGSCTVLEWEERRRRCAFAGKKLNGLFTFRKLSAGGSEKWYIFRKDLEK